MVVRNYSVEQLRGTEGGTDVERRALLFEAAEIAIESGPINGEFVLVEKQLLGRDGFFILRSDGPAFARNFRSDPLGELAQRTIVEEKRNFGLSKHVNEARSDDAALRIDLALRARFTQITYGRHAIPAAADDTRIPGISRAIDDRTVADDEIVVARTRRGRQIRIVSG